MLPARPVVARAHTRLFLVVRYSCQLIWQYQRLMGWLSSLLIFGRKQRLPLNMLRLYRRKMLTKSTRMYSLRLGNTFCYISEIYYYKFLAVGN